MITTQRMVGDARPGTIRTPAVRFARVAGVVYCAAGIIGFGLTGFTGMMNTTGELLFGFEVNGLQNLLHVVVGVALVAASGSSPEAARVLTMLTAAAFTVAGLLGLSIIGTDANVLALNRAANTAHLLTAVVAAACAAASPRTAR
ncbi:MAG: DUF4383 domain-containing protein [Nitriliruptor sp.]